MSSPSPSSLAEIRQELQRLLPYVDDPELRRRGESWLDESYDRTEADTAQEFLDAELTAMLKENAMYHAPELEHGAEAFPDACEDCRHYGSACPLFRDRVEKRWREKRLEQAETDQEAREVYQQQAIDIGCLRIPEFLETFDDQHADFTKAGRDLVREVRDEISTTEIGGIGLGDDDDGTDPEPEPVATDGGGGS